MEKKLRRTKRKNDPPDYSFFRANKSMCRRFGPEVAVFMANLMENYIYWKEKDKNKKFNGTFFLTHERQSDQTGMSSKIIKRCKEIAVLNGWITTRKHGIPAREWYEIHVEHSDLQQARTKSEDLVRTKCPRLSGQKVLANNNNIIKTIYNSIYTSLEGSASSKEEEELELSIKKYVTYRQENKLSVDVPLMEDLAKRFASVGTVEKIITHINKCITKGWKGVPPLKATYTKYKGSEYPSMLIEIDENGKRIQWYHDTTLLGSNYYRLNRKDENGNRIEEKRLILPLNKVNELMLTQAKKDT